MTSVAAELDQVAPDSEHPHGQAMRRIEPFDLLLVVATVGAGLAVIDTIYDINDLFWHVLIGDQILSGVPFDQLGSDFSFGAQNSDWRTGAWASEVILSWLYGFGGWPFLVNVIRLGALAGIAFLLWRFVVIRFPAKAVALPYFLAMAAVALTVQERPQAFSLVLLTLAGIWWFQVTVDGRVPKWYIVGFISMAWANLHGLWIVLPMVLLLALIGRMLDHGLTDDRRKPLLAAISASVVGGLLTPLGMNGPLLALQIRDAAESVIVEWQITGLYASPGFLLLIAGGLSIYLCGKVGAGRADLLYLAAVIVFGLMAVRNVAPSVLLLTPLLSSLIARVLGPRAEASTSARERVILKRAVAGIAALGMVCIGVTIGVHDQGPGKGLPIELSQELKRQPSPVRLFNEFNASGVALFFGGPETKVAVDGRTDYYGRPYLDRYQDAVLYGKGLADLVTSLDPTHALLQRDAAAAALLQNDGWTEIGSTNEYVLLVSP